MKVYFISGLAADSRAFKYIQLPEHCETVHLSWIPPLKNEKLKHYALRLAEKIDENEPFGIIGLSMGGMMASEIAQQCYPAVTVLISSIPSSLHLPYYYKIAGAMRLHKLIPVNWIKSGAFIKRYFSAENDADKKLIKQLIRESDNHFIKWAIDAILHWENKNLPPAYFHIHGSRDEILPIRFTRPTHVIKNAGHTMVLTHAAQVNQILKLVFDHS